MWMTSRSAVGRSGLDGKGMSSSCKPIGFVLTAMPVGTAEQRCPVWLIWGFLTKQFCLTWLRICGNTV